MPCQYVMHSQNLFTKAQSSQSAQLTLFGMICSALGVYQESKKDRPSHAKKEALRNTGGRMRSAWP